MQFQVLAQDFTDKDALNRRLSNREAHLKLGDEMIARGELLFAAAQLDGAGKMIGSTMIVEFPSEAELNTWLKVEPYVVGKVWDKVQITPCKTGPSFSRKPVQFDHVAILVKDLKSAVKDYKSLWVGLGLKEPKVAWHDGHRDGHTYQSATFVKENGETVLQFLQSEHPQDLRLLEKRGECVHHLEFCSDNVDGSLQKLKDAGIPLVDTVPVISEDMSWQKSIVISPQKTHGVLVKITTSYRVNNSKWIPRKERND